MSKEEKVTIAPEVIEKITAYVYKNYKSYTDKILFIDECSNCFAIRNHKDGSPLILGKGIIN